MIAAFTLVLLRTPWVLQLRSLAAVCPEGLPGRRDLASWGAVGGAGPFREAAPGVLVTVCPVSAELS